MSTLEEVEKRRAARRATHDTARAAQMLEDVEAIDSLEAASGEPLSTMTTSAFRPGVPVKIAFRAPLAVEYKRYCDMVGRAQQKSDPVSRLKAQEMLAFSCLMYPAADTDARKALLDAFPGTLISVALEAAKLAELSAEELGKD